MTLALSCDHQDQVTELQEASNQAEALDRTVQLVNSYGVVSRSGSPTDAIYLEEFFRIIRLLAEA